MDEVFKILFKIHVFQNTPHHLERHVELIIDANEVYFYIVLYSIVDMHIGGG